MSSPVLLVAFLCGLLPALLWLSFWLFEDKKNPEPKRYIFFTFLAGMLIVLPFPLGNYTVGLVLDLEKLVQTQAIAVGYPAQALIVHFYWAAIEETF